MSKTLKKLEKLLIQGNVKEAWELMREFGLSCRPPLTEDELKRMYPWPPEENKTRH